MSHPERPIADESTIQSKPRFQRSEPGGEGRILPALTILAHPDASRVGERAVLGELAEGGEASIARLHPDLAAPGRTVGRPLADRHLSRRPVRIESRITSHGDGRCFLDASETSTSVRVGTERVRDRREILAEDLDHGVVIGLAERIVLLFHLHDSRADPDAETARDDLGLVGGSAEMARVREEIRRVADLDVGVLIRGETGTGKELVARALHASSRREKGPFVALNLGVLTPSLAASELFGTTKGAFTGADTAREGAFGRADSGTLLLDEIGEAPEEIQVALLRALETGEIQPVGASSPRAVDVRVLAATDADLEAEIAEGGFRAPLLHRLATYEVWLPPLRERRADLGELVVHFLRQAEEEVGDRRLGRDDGEPWIDPELMARLVDFDWPGNVRQLRNAVRQLAIAHRGRPCLRSTPAIERLLRASPEPTVPPVDDSPPRRARRRLPSEVDDEEIVASLREHRYEVKAAAEALGFSRAALYAWIEESPRIQTAGQLDAETVRRAHAELDGDLDALVSRLEVSRFALQRRLRELGL